MEICPVYLELQGAHRYKLRFKIYAGLIEKVSMEETKGNADTTT